MNKLIIIFIITLNLIIINGQWYNVYRYSNSNCNEQNEIPALISNKLDVCLESIKYSCNDNSTTETFYKNDNCETKTTQKSFNNNICYKGEIMNCSSTLFLPPNSFIMAVYPNDDVNCGDDSRITQYSTIPLNTCNFGLLYKCDSNFLIVEKYSDENCTNLSNKSKEQLGCVHNNPFYKVLKYYCTI